MKIKAVIIKKGYTMKEMGGEFSIFHDDDLNNGAVDGMPSINETGLFLWDRILCGVSSPDELIRELMLKNSFDYDDAEADVSEFVAKLINGKVADVIKED